ncbi:serine/threonine-protein kinase [Phytohabitans sp. LJ34]|uniref:serine/threonine-protein kinase n=1 Tax=Phytohabitans sp. LJ34 TaxID=3452217 RepID=UPI003F89D16D
MWRVLIAERYSLVKPVGSGGMGRVWLARDEMLRREVAIKEVVPPDWMTAEEREMLRETTIREARAAAQLNHPNAVQIYDVVYTEGRPWIVMEYVPSRSLQEVVQQDGPLPPERVAQIGLAVLYALRAAHVAGVLHRDVKPHNVLIAEDGRVVLTDFGLATFDGGDGALTRAGLIMGSPQYVAPERAKDGISTVETDLWSLGATLFAAVEGRSPYARSTTMATLTALATAPPDPATHAGALRPVLGGLLRKDPKHRLNGAEAERLLRRAALPPPAVPPRTRLLPRPRRSPDDPRPEFPAEGSGRRRRRLAIAATAALVAAISAATAVVALSRDDRRTGQLVGASVPSSSPSAPASGAGAGTGMPCGSPPTDAGLKRPEPPATPRFALADGFAWHADPSGFRVAVPSSWTYYRDGDVVCFREPGSPRLLAVDTAPGLKGDPVKHWESEERKVVAGGALNDYRKVAILPNRYFKGGADWDCTWLSAKGERLHARQELFRTSAKRAYTILWITRALDWAGNLAYLNMINASFAPAKG